MFITQHINLRKIQRGDSFEASFRVNKEALGIDLATCRIDALVKRYPSDVAVALTLDVAIDEEGDSYFIHLSKVADAMKIDIGRYWYSVVVEQEDIDEVWTAVKGIFEIVTK